MHTYKKGYEGVYQVHLHNFSLLQRSERCQLVTVLWVKRPAVSGKASQHVPPRCGCESYLKLSTPLCDFVHCPAATRLADWVPHERAAERAFLIKWLVSVYMYGRLKQHRGRSDSRRRECSRFCWKCQRTSADEQLSKEA